jgi:hypothetical protein
MKKRTINIPLPIRTAIGAGDVIKKAASVVGVKPCAACKKRAAQLNARIAFTPMVVKRPSQI